MSNYNTNAINKNDRPFLSHWRNALLAKAKSFNLPIEDSIDNETLCNIITEHEDELIRLSIRAIPPIEIEYLGEWEIEQIKKARMYNIPYKAGNVNWEQLSDAIYDYECLLHRAKDYDFNWDLNYYDPVGLLSLIEDYEQEANHREFMYRKPIWSV